MMSDSERGKREGRVEAECRWRVATLRRSDAEVFGLRFASNDDDDDDEDEEEATK